MPAHGAQAGNARGRSPVLVRLYGTLLSNPPRECRGAVPHDHSCLGQDLLRRAEQSVILCKDTIECPTVSLDSLTAHAFVYGVGDT